MFTPGEKVAAVTIFFWSLFLPVRAAILFEDNFDTLANWTVAQPLSADDSCSFNCGIPGEWDGYYNGRSWCSGGPGSNNVYINGTAGYPIESSNSACRSGSGKCATYWDESCNDFFEDSNGIIAVDLGQQHQEIWTRFFIKIGRKSNGQDYQLGYLDNDAPQHKILHMHAYDGQSSMFSTYCRALGNYPFNVWGWNAYEDHVYQYWGQRCWAGATTYEQCSAAYYCNSSSPTWRYDTNDMNYTHLHNSFDASLGDGSWHSIEVYSRINTYNAATGHWNSDGVMQVWYDGALVDNRSNVVYVQDGAASGIRGWRIVGYGGNNSNMWTNTCSGASCEQWYAIDDVVIATNYIGPDYVIGGGAPPDATPPTPPAGLNVR